jgi:hypothetical protein
MRSYFARRCRKSVVVMEGVVNPHWKDTHRRDGGKADLVENSP